MDSKHSIAHRAGRGNVAVQSCLIAGAILIIALTIFTAFANPEPKTPFEMAEGNIREVIGSFAALDKTLSESLAACGTIGSPKRCFVAYTDGIERAKVFYGEGASSEEAYAAAIEKASLYAQSLSGQKACLKAEFVNYIETVSSEDLASEVLRLSGGASRFGLSFDEGFASAFTEGEMNGLGIFDKDDENGIAVRRANDALRAKGMPSVAYLPEVMVKFSTLQYFATAVDAALLDGEMGSDSYGLRGGLDASVDEVESLLADNTRLLASLIREDGSFVYGKWPVSGNDIEGYNILRHIGATWALIDAYADSGDASLAPVIDSAIAYFLRTSVASPGGSTAYVVDKTENEIKLGGNGLAICMLLAYDEVFSTDQYLRLATQLGEGIIAQQNKDDGTYRHVLYFGDKAHDNYSLKAAYRTIYYDGEATYGLCKLYGVTTNPSYLKAARLAIGHFIAADYSQYADQWVAYALNEYTKYASDYAANSFAVRNISVNLRRMVSAPASSHISLEFLMASFEAYSRLSSGHRAAEGLAGFDASALAAAIQYRAGYMLTSRFYPETAMYMSKPNYYNGAFYIRNDEFRIRIDDIQHCMAGYRLYLKNRQAVIDML